MLPAWQEQPIAKTHDRAAFDCGDPDLNEFLLRYARQSHDRGSAKTFLAVSENKILGFYSLAPAALEYETLPGNLRRSLPRHPVPGFRLVRLATHISLHRQGLGSQLLLAAGRRCIRVAAEVGGVVLITDAKSARAAAWYASYGAVALQDAPLTLVMPLATINAAVSKNVLF